MGRDAGGTFLRTRAPVSREIPAFSAIQVPGSPQRSPLRRGPAPRPAREAAPRSAPSRSSTPSARASSRQWRTSFSMCSSLKSGLEVALEHRLALQAEHGRVPGAAGGHLEERVGVDARRLHREHRLRQRHRVDRAHRVGEQLRQLRRARAGPRARSARPSPRSSGLARSKSASSPPTMIVSVPSSAFGREPDTGASRKADAVVVQPLADRARGGRGDGGHVDRERALRQAVDGAVLAEQHLLDLGRVGDHRDHGRRRPRPPRAA